ncbi:GIY-YIG nuclease family protein [Polynucleobacter sp. 31A-FELB]|uniref:GIY-YIG nuclease family protein n=1 Tax=Polynucleobacter sp. 31A-FELB TaxID=2689096 RepID=UPI001C0DF223|nr:GIY-YIG nuclease family protein [Polynucleobacter sp. 31A-FELB]MBU3588178.1 GIY-YIG nuclease family protein [Polynucleobacter sp. 31A-FELB]
MAIGISYTAFGVAYKSQREAAEAYGMETGTLQFRLQSGMCLEDALTKKVNRRIWVVDGVEYKTLKEASAFYQIPYPRIQSRLRGGHSLDEAFEVSQSNALLKSKDKEFTVDGIAFATLSDAFRHFKLSKKVAENRKRLGWSFNQIFGFEPPPIPKRWATIICAGIEYKSIAALGRAFNLSRERLFTRLTDMGLTPEQAVGLEDNPKSKFTNAAGEDRIGIIYKINNTVNGKCYVGLTDGDLKTRWKQHRMGIHTGNQHGDGLLAAFREFGTEAFTIDVIEKSSVRFLGERESFYIAKYNSLAPNGYNLNDGGARGGSWGSPVLLRGEWYRSLKDVCEVFGANYKNVQQRMKTYGWSIEDAIGLTQNTNSQSLENMAVTVEGVRYSTKADAARHYGIPEKTVYARLKRGWSIDDAFKKPVRKR